MCPRLKEERGKMAAGNGRSNGNGAGNGKGSITWPQPGGGSYTAGAKFTFSRTGSVVVSLGRMS